MGRGAGASSSAVTAARARDRGPVGQLEDKQPPHRTPVHPDAGEFDELKRRLLQSYAHHPRYHAMRSLSGLLSDELLIDLHISEVAAAELTMGNDGPLTDMRRRLLNAYLSTRLREALPLLVETGDLTTEQARALAKLPVGDSIGSPQQWSALRLAHLRHHQDVLRTTYLNSESVERRRAGKAAINRLEWSALNERRNAESPGAPESTALDLILARTLSLPEVQDLYDDDELERYRAAIRADTGRSTSAAIIFTDFDALYRFWGDDLLSRGAAAPDGTVVLLDPGAYRLEVEKFGYSQLLLHELIHSVQPDFGGPRDAAGDWGTSDERFVFEGATEAYALQLSDDLATKRTVDPRCMFYVAEATFIQEAASAVAGGDSDRAREIIRNLGAEANEMSSINQLSCVLLGDDGEASRALLKRMLREYRQRLSSCGGATHGEIAEQARSVLSEHLPTPPG